LTDQDSACRKMWLAALGQQVADACMDIRNNRHKSADIRDQSRAREWLLGSGDQPSRVEVCLLAGVDYYYLATQVAEMKENGWPAEMSMRWRDALDG